MKELWKKFKDEKTTKDLLTMMITTLIVICVALLLVDVLGQNRDGRNQIVSSSTDLSAATEINTEDEIKLQTILSKIEGVGSADVMISKNSQNVVEGVIIVASGAEDATTRLHILDAVASLYDLPVDKIAVFRQQE